jgi:transcriptional regulator with XRE-family HTH domain
VMTAGDEPGAGRAPAGQVPLPRLRELRQARFLSQEALADRAKVSHFTVRRIEQGLPARYQTVRKLAEALEVEPAELAGTAPPPAQRVAEPRARYDADRARPGKAPAPVAA